MSATAKELLDLILNTPLAKKGVNWLKKVEKLVEELISDR